MDISTEEPGGDILVVDDDATSRIWARVWLQKGGFSVREAATAQEALAAMASCPPDLILLDVMLPDMDGFELTRRVRSDPNLATVPIVLLTVLSDPGSKVRGLEAGAYEFLSKPLSSSELLARVRMLLRLKRNQEVLQAEQNRTALLYQVSRDLNTELDLDRVLSGILRATVAAVGASRGSIILLDEQRRILRHIFLYQDQVAKVRREVQEQVVRQGLAGWVLEHGVGVIVPDVLEDPRWVALTTSGYVTRSALVVPLIYREQMVGVLTLAHEEVNRFTQSDLDLVMAIASQSAAALVNARLFQEVKEERARLEAILSSTDNAIIAVDHEGRVALLNPAAARAFGVSARQAVGQMLDQAIPHSGLVQSWRRASASGATEPAELTLADGRVLFCTFSPVLASGEGGGGWVMVMQDITHLKQLDRLKSEFVSTVSHDLRTPLATIHGFGEVLVKSLDGENRECAQQICVQARQMSRLVEELLDLAKIEAGVESVRVSCSLADLIAEAVTAARFQADTAGVMLQADVAACLPPVAGNPVRLRQALDNLIGNALKYTPPGGQVTVRAWARGEQVLVTVQDSGPGIPRENLPRLFEKFYRVPGQEGRSAGTGLGLAIVKAVIEQHGGQVWVESELGQGSTFGFSLPIPNEACGGS